MNKLNGVVFYILLPVAGYMLFKKLLDETILIFLIKNALSFCYPENARLDIATIIISTIIFASIIFRRVRGAIIGHTSIYLLIDYLIVYAFYRIPGDPFAFTGFSFSVGFKLLDTAAIISFVAILLSIITPKKKLATTDNQLSFTVDEPIIIDAKNDLLNRSKFIEGIAARIINTDTPNGSFPIGVIAAWGSGKTTFLHTLSSDLEKSNSKIIRIDFNAWKCINSSQIIEAFFKQLKSELSKYSYTVENKVEDYISNLIKGTQVEGLNSFKNILEAVFPSKSIEEQYGSINNEIKRIGKKIVVFIDDLDRLDKKEIYEVIRLIRNTANFSNTFYVVAYDRNYLLNAIEEINSYQAHQFLEKIFQVEFALPPIKNIVLQNEISKRIESFITDSDVIAYKAMIKVGGHLYDYESKLNLAPIMIYNVRDVVRFVNSFKLSYQFVKGEVSFVEFYNLEIIRFKHPELFVEIYRSTHKLFSTEKESNYANSNFVYCLRKVKDNLGNENEVSELEIFLKEQANIYKLSQKDIGLLVSAYLSVFPYIDKFNGYSETKKGFLSVIKPSMYDRYFVLGIEGKLSQIEFAKLRLLPLVEFSTRLARLIIENDFYSDVTEKLESIKEFDNKEEFEKIISVILYIANLPNKKDEYSSDIFGYNEDSLAEMLGAEAGSKLYADKSYYKTFLQSVLITETIDYKYENQFLKSLIKRNFYFVKDVFSKEELSNISIENFKNCLRQSKKGTKDVWSHFWSCIERIETETNGGVTSISYPISEVARKLMRKFMFENDIDGLIRGAIKPTPFDERAKLNEVFSFLYGSNEVFVWLLKRSKQNSFYKEEFLKFYNECSKNEEIRNMGMPLSFFKDIPVSNFIWNE